MAKRVRTSRSSHRPGGQGPSRTKSSDTSASEDDDGQQAMPAEDIGATYSEVEVDEEAAAAVAATAAPAATATAEAPRKPRRRARRAKKARPDDLAAISTAETVWVRSDLRRIGIVSVILIVALAVCWVIFGVMDVLSLY